MKSHHHLIVCQSAQELYRKAAQNFADQARKAIARHQKFTVLLSGGSTPKGIFTELCKDYLQKAEWQKIVFFWGDERYVPQVSDDSNYKMAKDYLFSKLPILAENIFAIPTHFSHALEAAGVYQNSLNSYFNASRECVPQFDLVFLGMGDDAHTASLFPGTQIVDSCAEGSEDPNEFFTAHFVEKVQQWRITATPVLLNNAREIVFLISGSNKAIILSQILYSKYDPKKYPIQLITQSHKRQLFFLDFPLEK